jgi:hypothetical protein
MALVCQRSQIAQHFSADTYSIVADTPETVHFVMNFSTLQVDSNNIDLLLLYMKLYLVYIKTFKRTTHSKFGFKINENF